MATMDPVSPAKTSRYDLHTHSRHSDGTLSPTELVQRAHARGVAVLALTDHDVTDGLTEATTQAGAFGMTLIAGVEVSVTWQNQTVHIVGLNIDAALPALQHGLAGLREFRHWRAQEIDRRLARKRILGALEGASRHAHGAILSRTHFARFLVEQGHARDLKHAFKHFLTRSKPGYVPGRWAPLDAAVRWLRDAGGVAVIAHPARYRFSAGKLRTPDRRVQGVRRRGDRGGDRQPRCRDLPAFRQYRVRARAARLHRLRLSRAGEQLVRSRSGTAAARGLRAGMAGMGRPTGGCRRRGVLTSRRGRAQDARGRCGILTKN